MSTKLFASNSEPKPIEASGTSASAVAESKVSYRPSSSTLLNDAEKGALTSYVEKAVTGVYISGSQYITSAIPVVSLISIIQVAADSDGIYNPFGSACGRTM